MTNPEKFIRAAKRKYARVHGVEITDESTVEILPGGAYICNVQLWVSDADLRKGRAK